MLVAMMLMTMIRMVMLSLPIKLMIRKQADHGHRHDAAQEHHHRAAVLMMMLMTLMLTTMTTSDHGRGRRL